MTSFCDCETCREVKKRLKYPKCSYCGKHHDTKMICPEYKEVVESTRLKDFCPSCNTRHAPDQVRCPDPKKDKYETKVAKDDTLKNRCEYYLELEGGKYTVFQEKGGALKALRYGGPWQDLCGNNLVFYLMVELIEAKKEIARLNDINW